jgi:hypothetical protein
LLVARSVAPAKAGRPSNHSLENESSAPAKTSMNQFADLAGVSVSHVKYYYDAWELAAKAGLVPAAGKVEPGDEDVCVDVDAIEVEDDPKTQWSWFYSIAKNPPKNTEKKEDSKSKQQKPPADDSDEDEDDDVDDDFGIKEPKISKEQAAEADSSIQRNELLEILESVRAIQGRMDRVEIAKADNVEIMGQIATAGMSLSMTADALIPKNEDVKELTG